MGRRRLPAALAALAFSAARALAQDAASGNALEDLERASRALVERCAPAVVRVEGERTAQLRILETGPEERRALEEKLLRFMPRESVSAAGFVVDEGRWVVTTSAAAAGANRVRVTFDRGAVRDGTLVGEDGIAGVALLRIEHVEGVAPLRLSAREARPGTISLLLAPEEGGPAALHFGFLTDPRRAFGRYDAWIVSSVPVAPGHAGSPLLDAAGDVLGIAVAAREEARTAMENTVRGLVSVEPGIVPSSWGAKREVPAEFFTRREATAHVAPFATFVPAAELRRILADLRSLGRVRRAMLGVRLPRGEPLVGETVEGTPAAKAGIVPLDRILSVDGVAVDDSDAFTGYIQRRAPGTEVRLRLRGPDGAERETPVVLGELAEPPPPK